MLPERKREDIALSFIGGIGALQEGLDVQVPCHEGMALLVVSSVTVCVALLCSVQTGGDVCDSTVPSTHYSMCNGSFVRYYVAHIFNT